jgi:hypothetical protein
VSIEGGKGRGLRDVISGMLDLFDACDKSPMELLERAMERPFDVKDIDCL